MEMNVACSVNGEDFIPVDFGSKDCESLSLWLELPCIVTDFNCPNLSDYGFIVKAEAREERANWRH